MNENKNLGNGKINLTVEILWNRAVFQLLWSRFIKKRLQEQNMPVTRDGTNTTGDFDKELVTMACFQL